MDRWTDRIAMAYTRYSIYAAARKKQWHIALILCMQSVASISTSSHNRINDSVTLTMNKTKVMISGEWQKVMQKAVRWPCGVCGRGVGNNSIQCTSGYTLNLVA